jgi:hypothetical protein
MIMKTALDALAATLDKHEQNFVANIRRHGWFDIQVFPEDDLPGFSYTTGFFLKFGFPEMIIFSMKPKIAHDVFWNMYHALVAHESFPLNQPINSIFESGRAALFEVSKSHYEEHLGWSCWFYGNREFPCVQLVWTDKEDRFPWEDGFDESFKGLQLDLTQAGWLATLAH